MNKLPICPKCFSDRGSLVVEKRPGGDARCVDCFWSGKYDDCFKTKPGNEKQYHPSRRDYFAAAALQGYLASNLDLCTPTHIGLIAKAADYIIAELDKEK